MYSDSSKPPTIPKMSPDRINPNGSFKYEPVKILAHVNNGIGPSPSITGNMAFTNPTLATNPATVKINTSSPMRPGGASANF